MTTSPDRPANATKLTDALMRDARSLLRRADKLATAATVVDDHAVRQSADAAREAAEHLVRQLGSLQQREHRRTREVIRRGR
jgi:hypothetical protein